MEQPIIKEWERAVMEWESPLRQFIDMATRYTFSHNNEGKKDLHLIFLNVDEGRRLFEIFKAGLLTWLTEVENWRAIGFALNKRFLLGIRQYYNWYEENAEYRAYFGEFNRYDQILNLAESTEREICQYFPDLAIPIEDHKKKPVADASHPKNVFNEMEIEQARAWFMQLSTSLGKGGVPFLTQQQVETFIGRAFIGESFNEKLSINERKGDKGSVIGLFHKFYEHCTMHRPKTGKVDKNASSQKYIKLLTDHFDNWAFDEVVHNFRSGGRWETPVN